MYAMYVDELDSYQLLCLKWKLFCGDDTVELTEKQRNCLSYCEYPEEIPDNLVCEVYDGISFVYEDFA